MVPALLLWRKWCDVALKYVVLGTGRSGTGYMSWLLNACGIKCGHESLFRREGYDVSRAKSYDADSSFWAVPYRAWIPRSACVVHAVRDPLRVFRSWLVHQPGKGNSEKIKELGYLIEHPLGSIEYLWDYWLTWHRISESIADVTVRVEDRLEICDKLGLARPAEDREQVNPHVLSDAPLLTWDDLPDCDEREIVRTHSERYGYRY